MGKDWITFKDRVMELLEIEYENNNIKKTYFHICYVLV